jgi:antitoxin component YwqK of YwqJK toxin-antitoxin module
MNGREHGKFRGFDEDGNLESEITYRMGKFISERLKRHWSREIAGNKTYFEATRKIEDGLCVDRDLKGKELATHAVGMGYCQ